MITINSFLLAFIIIYISGSVAGILLDILNSSHLKKIGQKAPACFEGFLDDSKLARMTSYTAENTRVSLIQGIAGIIFMLAIILYGFLPWLSDSLKGMHYIIAGLIFFAVPGAITSVIGLPFSYYSTFVVEERYGFNTSSLKIWVMDHIKTLIISVILGGILLSIFFLMVNLTGKMWWIYAWAIFIVFQLLMTVLYPTVIAPLFNKFTPVEDKGLEQAIRALSEKSGVHVTAIFQMDAGRRSRHSNAYFTGLGKSKRIVLYDTLISSHEKDEILAVLAHEIGHLKKGHIKRQLVLMGIVSFVLFYIAARMLSWEIMYKSFGFTEAPFYAGLFLIGVIWEPLAIFISPLFAAISRRYEREADRFAHDALNDSKPLISALRKMALDNLSNLCPHPLYVKIHYSHPPIAERIANLASMCSYPHSNAVEK
jgi:STE24 endopeptidase